MDPFALIPLGVGVTLGAVALFRFHQDRERFFRAAELDDDVVPWRVNAHPFALRSKSDPRCTIGSFGGGRNAPPMWHIVLDVDHALAARTTFSIGLEGHLSRLAKKAGRGDVEIGDRAFDERFAVKAEDPDTLRGLFADERVKSAALRVLEDPRFTSIALDRAGVVRAKLKRPHTDFVSARRALLDVVAFSRALDDARDAPPVRDPSPLLLTGASSSSQGSSVAIPLHISKGSP